MCFWLDAHGFNSYCIVVYFMYLLSGFSFFPQCITKFLSIVMSIYTRYCERGELFLKTNVRVPLLQAFCSFIRTKSISVLVIVSAVSDLDENAREL